MEILDINGKQIQRNLQVKYIRTHTTGNVTDILVKNDTVWIRLDSTGLYYRVDYIGVVENNKAYMKPDKKKNRLKPDKFNVANPAVISDHADGPGYGGG